MAYDLIVVLGSKPDTANWLFPSHVYASLERAAQLLQNGAAPCIAVSGKWALSFDHAAVRQPFRECDAMADYLVEQGVAPESILREGESKDTIANLYCLKRTIVAPRGMKRVLIITADFRLARLQYLAQKIFGRSAQINFETVPSSPSEPYPHEADTLARTKQFLAGMTDGDDRFLDGKFYGAPYYQEATTNAAKHAA